MKDQIAIVTAVAAAMFLGAACGNDNHPDSNGAAGSAGAGGQGGATGNAGAGTTGTSGRGGSGAAGFSGGSGGTAVGGSSGRGGGGGAGGNAEPSGAGGSAERGGAGGGAAGRGGAGGTAARGGTGGTGGRGGASGTAGRGGAGPGGAGGAAGGGGTSSTACANPVFTTSDTNGGWSNGGYYVHNNVWNAAEAGPETLYACSYKNWYVRSTQPSTTSVKAYPNVHLDINNLNGRPISNYTSITSTFAAASPGVGIYDVAYDIWLDGVGWGNGTTEVMIWTDNHKQAPLGTTVATAMAFSGKTYDVYRYTSNSDGGVQVISLLSTALQTSGSVDLKAIFDWIVSKGWIGSNATVNQIGYGVEICSTDNQAATFYFTDFSVTMN
jgi:hypothetical protein